MIQIRELAVSVTHAFSRVRNLSGVDARHNSYAKSFALCIFVIVVRVFLSSQRQASAAAAHDFTSRRRLQAVLGLETNERRLPVCTIQSDANWKIFSRDKRRRFGSPKRWREYPHMWLFLQKRAESPR